MRLRLESALDRYRLYAGVGVGVVLLALFFISFKPRFNFVVSDGRGYYVYLPSLVIDGDLDFANQIREHWDTDFRPELLQDRTERGYVKNRYPVGLALTLAPPFLAAHAAAGALYAATGWDACRPDGYSVPYQLLALLSVVALGVGSLGLADHLLTACFGLCPRATAVGVLLFWVGSPYLYYTCREPLMVHVVSGFWVNLCLVSLFRFRERLRAGCGGGGWLLLAAWSASTALVCRPTNAFLFLSIACILGWAVRHVRFVVLARALAAALAGLAPLAVQLFIWERMTGHWVHYSYEAGFDWAHPAAWQTLFSSRHGLFFWSPLLALALGGLIWRLCTWRVHREPLLACLAASFLALWYFNSCWPCWWFGDSFGGRAFLELSSPFVLGLASALEATRRAGERWRRALQGFLAAALAYELGLMGLYILHLIPRGDYLF
jgi:hypothetical protein